jgi:hypothetical protein
LGSDRKPKSLGGWGIRNLDWFSQALAAKSLWRALFGTGLWSLAMHKKYLKGVDVIFWLRNENYRYLVASLFWRNLLLSVPLLKKWLAWSFGTGTRVLVGLDPFVGSGPSFRLSTGLISHLHTLNIFSLADISHTSPYNVSGSHDWLTPIDLGLEGDLASEWDSYTLMLRCSGVSLRNEEDTILWTWNKSLGVVTVKSAYDALVVQNVKEVPDWWFELFGKYRFLVKIILFVWLCLQNHILTGENYRK